MDADEQLKDIRMGVLPLPVGWNKDRFRQPPGKQGIIPEIIRARSAYDEACKQYGIAPYWTVEGKERVERIINRRRSDV